MCVKVRSLPLWVLPQCHLQRNAGVTSTVAAVAFRTRGQQNRLKLLPVWFPPTHLFPSGAYLFWAISNVTYQHLPCSLCLPFKSGFDITDSHVAIFLKEGGMGIESVKSVASLWTQHLPRDNWFIQTGRGAALGQRKPKSIEKECLEVPAERKKGRGREVRMTFRVIRGRLRGSGPWH